MPSSVDPAVYNAPYFQARYQNIDYQKLKDLNEFDHIYQTAGALIRLKADDKVVDFGCGAGHLAFYLYLKYGCDITGLDYSPDALFFCHQNLNMLKNRKEYSYIGEKVRFLPSVLNNLPDFKNIQAVFLLDILEHLYDGEIEVVLEKIKNWSGKSSLQIVIHTDNYNYLRFVRPLTDWLLVTLGKKTRGKIEEEKALVARGHINLTTAKELQRKLKKQGWKILKTKYPTININLVQAHLGALGKIKPIVWLAYGLGKVFYFLRPSFYIVASV